MKKKMEATIVYRGYIGMMEEKMEATIVYRGYIGIMEKWKLLIMALKLVRSRTLGHTSRARSSAN